MCTHSDTICAAACTRATLQVTITGGKPFSSHAPEFSAKALIGSFLISIAYRSNFLFSEEPLCEFNLLQGVWRTAAWACLCCCVFPDSGGTILYIQLCIYAINGRVFAQL